MKRSRTTNLKEHLLQAMMDSKIPLGGRLPSESELMTAFSLSRSSVRQVLSELSVAGWVERRQGSGTYRIAGQNREPTQLRRTMLVGVWFNWPSGPLFGPIAEGIREELKEWGYHAVFEDTGLEVGAEARGVEALVHKAMDGFIVAPSTNPDDDHRPLVQLIERKVPLVLVDRLLPGHVVDLVTTTNELGAEETIQSLIQVGHRRIAFIGSGSLSTVDERLRGYKMAMRRAGLALEEPWLQTDEAAGIDSGRHAAEFLLGLPAPLRPTAIFGSNDIIAETVAIVAAERGLRVPQDLSVVGFDDIMPAAQRAPWLTTYAQPKRRIGQQAARLLLQRINNPGGSTVTVMLEGALVRRESTAPPPAEAVPA